MHFYNNFEIELPLFFVRKHAKAKLFFSVAGMKCLKSVALEMLIRYVISHLKTSQMAVRKQ